MPEDRAARLPHQAPLVQRAGALPATLAQRAREFMAPTPFGRLVRTHLVTMCADACVAVSLAGSLFFQKPSSGARGSILLYLLLTIAPFAIVAPIIGPGARPHRRRTAPARRRLVPRAGRPVLRARVRRDQVLPGGSARLPVRVRDPGAVEGLLRRRAARWSPPSSTSTGRWCAPTRAWRSSAPSPPSSAARPPRSSSGASARTGRCASRCCSSSSPPCSRSASPAPAPSSRPRSSSSPARSCTSRRSCSPGRPWRSCAARWGSSSSSPRSPSRATSCRWASSWPASGWDCSAGTSSRR